MNKNIMSIVRNYLLPSRSKLLSLRKDYLVELRYKICVLKYCLDENKYQKGDGWDAVYYDRWDWKIFKIKKRKYFWTIMI